MILLQQSKEPLCDKYKQANDTAISGLKYLLPRVEHAKRIDANQRNHHIVNHNVVTAENMQ